MELKLAQQKLVMGVFHVSLKKEIRFSSMGMLVFHRGGPLVGEPSGLGELNLMISLFEKERGTVI